MEIYWLAFITGLTTGGVSCFVVQGGLLASALTDSPNHPKKSLLLFLIAKLITYTLVGFLLGAIGSKLIISSKAQGCIQILIGSYMLITAANLANIHPFFRHFVIRPPKFIFRLLRKVSISGSLLTPIFLGALTILIPCGVTQAMMLLSVSAGSPIISAGILFTFVLGTIPVFFMIGLAANELFKHKTLVVVAALLVAGMGIYSINSGQTLRGSVHTIQNYWSVLTRSDLVTNQATFDDGFQNVTITVTSHGYTSNVNTLKLGVPVRLTLVTNGVASCARAFTIPGYNISKVLPVTGTEIIEFTPTKTGLMTYTCSMGMYSGSFNIIE